MYWPLFLMFEMTKISGRCSGSLSSVELQFAQLAEAGAEADVVLVAEFTSTEVDDLVLLERIAHGSEFVVRERSGKVDAEYFGAQRSPGGGISIVMAFRSGFGKRFV
jgi:hypothetical protein